MQDLRQHAPVEKTMKREADRFSTAEQVLLLLGFISAIVLLIATLTGR